MSKIDLYDNDFEKFVYTKILPVFLFVLFFLIVILCLLAIVKIASL